jgi:hypothetical protein
MSSVAIVNFLPDLLSRADKSTLLLRQIPIFLFKMGWFWADSQPKVPVAPHPTAPGAAIPVRLFQTDRYPFPPY